jgi:sec-independent protein translocase protein TatC
MRRLLRFIWRLLTAPFRWIASSIRQAKEFLTQEPEDTPLPDVVAKTVNDIDGLFFHLNELRKRLLWSVIFLAITTGISFAFAQQLIAILSHLLPSGVEMQAIDVTEPISVFMKVSLLSGFALALPFIVFQLWLFAAPGLKKKERYGSFLAIPLVVLFFVGGMLFAYYVMLPYAIPVLLNFMGIHTVPRPSSFISFVTAMLFWTGIIFEFPLVIYVLAAIGFVRGKMLLDNWRLAIVIITIVAAVITPTVDPVTMMMVAGPMILLYFLSVGLAFMAQRSREQRIESTAS